VACSAEAKQRQRNRAVRATSYGGGQRLTAREDGQDTGGRWGDVKACFGGREMGVVRWHEGGAGVGEKSSTATTRSG
jgi:hypothetical protein